MRSVIRWIVFILTVLVPAGAAWAEPNIHDTRLLTQPALSTRHVAFVYADSLWIADIDGKNARRLTGDVAAICPVLFAGRSDDRFSVPNTTGTSTFTRFRSAAARRPG